MDRLTKYQALVSGDIVQVNLTFPPFVDAIRFDGGALTFNRRVGSPMIAIDLNTPFGNRAVSLPVLTRQCLQLIAKAKTFKPQLHTCEPQRNWALLPERNQVGARRLRRFTVPKPTKLSFRAQHSDAEAA